MTEKANRIANSLTKELAQTQALERVQALITEAVAELEALGCDILSITYDNTWTQGQVSVHIADPNLLKEFPGELTVEEKATGTWTKRNLRNLEVVALSKIKKEEGK